MSIGLRVNSLNQLIRNGRVIAGRWKLGPKNELFYNFDPGQPKDLDLKADIVSIEPGDLVAAVSFREDGKSITQTLRLAGRWDLDSRNRLTFEVRSNASSPQKLVLEGAWQVDDNHRLVFTRTIQSLKTKKKIAQAITIDGYWDILEKHRLTYLIEGDDTSVLKFRGAFQTKSILAKKGEIRFQLGAQLTRGKKSKALTLFGKWKVSRDLGLSFEIDYDGKKKSIALGGEYRLSESVAVTVSLKTRQGAPLGAELILTKDIFDSDGQVFLRLQKSLQESRIEAGAQWRW